mmetsp:Transcript_33755/g.85330  ORF Transcript_33755/g.85330 Transcript_33755/m.85330 type:complete len:247 (-) Transcript_33755:578-1318(-)
MCHRDTAKLGGQSSSSPDGVGCPLEGARQNKDRRLERLKQLAHVVQHLGSNSGRVSVPARRGHVLAQLQAAEPQHPLLVVLIRHPKQAPHRFLPVFLRPSDHNVGLGVCRLMQRVPYIGHDHTVLERVREQQHKPLVPRPPHLPPPHLPAASLEEPDHRPAPVCHSVAPRGAIHTHALVSVQAQIGVVLTRQNKAACSRILSDYIRQLDVGGKPLVRVTHACRPWLLPEHELEMLPPQELSPIKIL